MPAVPGRKDPVKKEMILCRLGSVLTVWEIPPKVWRCRGMLLLADGWEEGSERSVSVWQRTVL